MDLCGSAPVFTAGCAGRWSLLNYLSVVFQIRHPTPTNPSTPESSSNDLSPTLNVLSGRRLPRGK